MNFKSDRKSKATPPPLPFCRSLRTRTYPGGVISESKTPSCSQDSVTPITCGENVDTKKTKLGNLLSRLLALTFKIVRSLHGRWGSQGGDEDPGGGAG